MSRTYKDKPYRFKHDAWDKDTVRIGAPYFFKYLQLPTTKTKKRKEVDTEDRWMSTPSWWNHMMHTKKRRRAAKVWEVNVLKAVDLEEVDKPNESNKPHQYFY